MSSAACGFGCPWWAREEAVAVWLFARTEGVQGGVLLLAGSGVGGGGFGFGTAAIAAGHRLRLSHSASPALGALATCIGQGVGGAEGGAEEQ